MYILRVLFIYTFATYKSVIEMTALMLRPTCYWRTNVGFSTTWV